MGEAYGKVNIKAQKQNIKIYGYSLGPLQTNAYVVANQQTKRAVLIDAVSDAPELSSQWEGWQMEAILQTHAHFDHIGGLASLAEMHHTKVYIHKEEADWLSDPHKNGAAWLGAEAPIIPAYQADCLLTGGEEIQLLDQVWHVLYTPGHSPGGLSFWLPDVQTVFSGDALFAGSIGRTDLPGGDHRLLLQSIRKQLLPLPEDTIVYPGHGPQTAIGIEKIHNPFLT